LLKRTKRRYLAVEIESETRFSSLEFMDALWGAVVKLYGEYGASRTGLVLINFNDEEHLAVIRSTLVALDTVRVALTSIIAIARKPAAVQVVSISGTLKALRGRIRH
jgi:RNase P/RNase MRP subunit POP5